MHRIPAAIPVALYLAALAFLAWSLLANAGHDARWLLALVCALGGLIVTCIRMLDRTETEN